MSIIIIIISRVTPLNNSTGVYEISICGIIFLMIVIVIIINHITILDKNNHDCHYNHIGAHGA